jgi:hypothetical protein
MSLNITTKLVQFIESLELISLLLLSFHYCHKNSRISAETYNIGTESPMTPNESKSHIKESNQIDYMFAHNIKIGFLLYFMSNLYNS